MFFHGCRYSHNILHRQPREVLKKFGIDVTQDPMNLVRMIRFKKGCENAEEDDSDDSRRDSKTVQSRKRRIDGASSSMGSVVVKTKRQSTSEVIKIGS